MGKVQGELALPEPKRRGGARRGAGRPVVRMLVGERKQAAHVARPAIKKKTVLNVTLRMVPAVREMRRREVYAALRRAMQAVWKRAAFRVLHVSLQDNHLHLIVEADSKVALANGMRAFQISFAQLVNQRIILSSGRARKGRVFADRYYARVMTSPTEVRNAIRYVLRGSIKTTVDAGSETGDLKMWCSNPLSRLGRFAVGLVEIPNLASRQTALFS